MKCRPGPVRASPGSPVFERVGGNPLYALNTRGDAAAPGYWAGFRLRTSGTPPATLTLGEAWTNVGVYLFCGADPTGDPAGFIAAVDGAAGAGVRFLWIADPAAPSAGWTVDRLFATPLGTGTVWRVDQPARFTLGAYSLEVVPGTWLQPSAAGAALPVIEFTQYSMVFTAYGTAFPAVRTLATLPLAGPGLGAWSTMVGLPATPTGPDGLAKLGVQLRYALPDPDDPGGAAVRQIPMPVLRQGASTLVAHLSYDPVHPLLAARTALDLFPPSGGQPTGPLMNTALRTVLGHPVQLTPIRPAAPLRSARFVFCSSPLRTDPADPGRDYHLAPDGAFTLSSPVQPGAQQDRRLLLGLSGGEFAMLTTEGRATVHFDAGRPAYAPGPGAAVPPPGGARLLTDAATTAYLAILPPNPSTSGLAYYAEPQQSPWYSATSAPQTGLLPSAPLPAAALPPFDLAAPQPPAALPVGVYTELDPALARAARVLEESALAQARRAVVAQSGGAPRPGSEPGPEPAATVRVVTPAGLMADVVGSSSPELASWERLVFASLPGAVISELAFTRIGPGLRGAMQAGELFFVVANPEAFMDDSSVRYGIDPLILRLLAARGVPADVLNRLASLLGRTFEDETAFKAELPAQAAPYEGLILAAAGLLKTTVEDWTFQLSPRSWRLNGDAPTLMVVKYAGRSLADLAARPAGWSWPKAAGDPEKTSGTLGRLFAAAAAAPEGSAYRQFSRAVVQDPAWNGVLFLNVPVAAAELPEELQFVTAGIDPDRFYAHHVGFPLTPVQSSGGGAILGRSGVFGLLHYEDLAGQAPESTVPFAFKTRQLTVRFAGGAIAELSAQVALVVNRLFGDVLTQQDPEHGNNLVLTGGYQRQNGVPSYAFALARPARFALAGSALDSVEVAGVELRTAAGSAADEGTLAVEFALSGALRFREFAHVDLFSYGPRPAAPAGQRPEDGFLRYSGLTVRMEFPVREPGRQTFRVDEGRIALDPGAGRARPASLASGFPVRVTGLLAVPAADGASGGRRPEDYGYAPVLAKLEQTPLEPPWYGLVYSLDLGTAGALAGSAGLSAGLLAGWSPGRGDEAQPPIYLGLKFADAPATDAGRAVQGVLRLGFRGAELLTVREKGKREYLLRLNRLALSVLGWSLPPAGLDLIIFGDPEADRSVAKTASPGWYAAYAPAREDGRGARGARGREAPAAVLRRLRSGRRSLPPGSGLRAGQQTQK
jgi:hypothetical protein